MHLFVNSNSLCDFEIQNEKYQVGFFSIVDILWSRLFRSSLVHDPQISSVSRFYVESDEGIKNIEFDLHVHLALPLD